MYKWRVAGADRNTGADRAVEIWAATPDEAGRIALKAGMLVASVEAVPSADPEPDPSDDATDPAVTAAVGGTLNYHGPVRGDETRTQIAAQLKSLSVGPPDYTPLLYLSWLLTVLAIAGYLLVGSLVVMGLVAIVSSTPIQSPFGGVAGASLLLIWGAAAAVPTMLLQAVEASLSALRDIARSVYRPI